MSYSDEFQFQISPASAKPMFLQFKEQLLANINRQALPQGARLPSLEKLALLAGVSQKTAYRGIEELIRERVCFRRPKKGTYVSGLAITPISRRKLAAIYHPTGLKQIKSSIIREEIYRGLIETATQCTLEFFFLSGEAVASLDFYQHNKEIDLCGVVIMDREYYGEGLRLAQIFPEVKFVYLNYHWGDFQNIPQNLYGVFNDEFSGGYQVGDYLSRRFPGGKLAIISVKLLNDNYRLRVKGFCQALDDNGFDRGKQLLIEEHNMAIPYLSQLQHIGYQMCAKLMELCPDLNALFVVNDLIAAGVKNKLQELGKHEKAEVFGYDNLFPEVSLDHHFSTVSVDFYGMGSRAVKIISGSGCCYSKCMLLNPQLIVRNPNFR